jgi:hypothetical protein
MTDGERSSHVEARAGLAGEKLLLAWLLRGSTDWTAGSGDAQRGGPMSEEENAER